MGMIIQVAFNNQNWSDKCKNAKSDKRLVKCQKQAVNTRYKVVDIDCLSEDCWESTLCTKYFWMSRGNFDRNRTRGDVFFVYPHHVYNYYVLWGKSKVKKVEGDKIHFEEFKPMQKPVKGFSAIELTGKNWGSGTYRYIDAEREAILNDLIHEKSLSNTT